MYARIPKLDPIKWKNGRAQTSKELGFSSVERRPVLGGFACATDPSIKVKKRPS